MNRLNLDNFKQGVADFYDRRSLTYDESEWRTQICHRLLEYSNFSVGQSELFEHSGFEAVEIKTEQHGSYTTLDKAKATWERVVVNPSITSPKVLGNGLSQLSSAQLAQVKVAFDAALQDLQTEQGIWDDLTTLYILGRKLVYRVVLR
ncbi:MAG: hypothetical protein ACFCU8_01835 [Thermosynechococcaceae cyanobacterium]